MNNWGCKKCGETQLKKLYSRTICNSCRPKQSTEYMREYMRTRRWLDGGPDNHLLGEELGSVIQGNINGNLILKV